MAAVRSIRSRVRAGLVRLVRSLPGGSWVISRLRKRHTASRSTATVATKATKATKATNATKRRASEVVTEARALLDSGVFDVEYYEAQVGKAFASDGAAAKHFVRYGTRTAASIHPLIETGSFSKAMIELLKSGSIRALLDELSSPSSYVRPWSPLFDPKVARRQFRPAKGTSMRSVRGRGEVLGYVRNMSPGDLLPVDPALGDARRTWGDARAHAIEAAMKIHETRPRLTPRRTKKWDEGAEQAWLASTEVLSLPDSAGPLVSVVMPVWNRPVKVVRAIRSVQAQTLSNWELVVVDDGSTDATLDVLRDEAKRDERIRVISVAHGGVSAARNAALGAAAGRYVAFLDSDNTWRPLFLATMMKAMHAGNFEAAYSALRSVQTEGENEVETYLAYRGGLADLLNLNHIDLNVFVVTLEIARKAGGFDPAIKRWVDHDFAIRVARHAEPQLLPFIGCDYDHEDSEVRITTTESDNWQFAVLGKAYVDWSEAAGALNSRVVGRTSVVIPTLNDVQLTTACVRSLFNHVEPGDDIEIVVVDNGSAAQIARNLYASLSVFSSPFATVRVERLPRNLNFATGSNYGFVRSTGDVVLFLNNDTVVRRGWHRPLRNALNDERVVGAQPLLVYPDDRIQACGTVFPVNNGLPVHILQGAPKDDARKVQDLKFRAVTAAALIMRARDVVALEGFDPIYANGQEDVDLCLRASDGASRFFRVVIDSVIEHHEGKSPGRGARVTLNRQIFFDRWEGRLPGPETDLYEAVGLEVAHVGSGAPPYSHPVPVVVRKRAAGGETGRVLRWSIKNPAIPGPRGDEWGDTHFIAALQKSLEGLGQEVVTYRHGTHRAPYTAMDDVNLVIRGLDRVHPQPGKVNVLWVISHPDMVTREELRGFQLVYAASVKWARKVSEEWGVEVRTLLQATDPDRFGFVESPDSLLEDVIFVGQARLEAPRQIVMDAISSGVDVKVWGPRWERHLGPERVRGDYYPNEQLPDAYAGAAVVLNDHWADMAADGFISNRLFDIVASGGRAVSDPVEGIEEIFGASVRTYRSADELSELCDPERIHENFAVGEERAKLAKAISEEHSFDARARTLMKDVAELISSRTVLTQRRESHE